MFRHTRTALKFLVYGLIIGLLFAPTSGEETRRRLMDQAKGLIGF